LRRDGLWTEKKIQTMKTSPATLKCPRCGVTVPYDKVLQKDRCLVKPSCPLNDMVRVVERLVEDGVEPR